LVECGCHVGPWFREPLIHKGLTVFAGVILAMVGVSQFFQGLVVVIRAVSP
jgi:hypothetical protein